MTTLTLEIDNPSILTHLKAPDFVNASPKSMKSDC